jgi:Transposase (partial DDE domain)
MHTQEAQQQFKQLLKKRKPGPVKAKVHASRTKNMVLTFFDSQGVICNNHVQQGQTVNSDCSAMALLKFFRHLQKKRLEFFNNQELFLHWDNAPPVALREASAGVPQKRGVKVLEHPLTHLTWTVLTVSCFQN